MKNFIHRLFNNDKLIVNSFYVIMIIYYAFRLIEITAVEHVVILSFFHIMYVSGDLIFAYILYNRIMYSRKTETGEGFALYEYRLVNILIIYELILIVSLVIQTIMNYDNAIFVEHIIHKLVINLLACNFLISRSSDLYKIIELADKFIKIDDMK